MPTVMLIHFEIYASFIQSCPRNKTKSMPIIFVVVPNGKGRRKTNKRDTKLRGYSSIRLDVHCLSNFKDFSYSFFFSSLFYFISGWSILLLTLTQCKCAILKPYYIDGFIYRFILFFLHLPHTNHLFLHFLLPYFFFFLFDFFEPE